MTKHDQLMIRARRLNPIGSNAFAGTATSHEGRQLLDAILSTDATVENPETWTPRRERISHRGLQLRAAAGLAVLIAAAVTVVSIDLERGERSEGRIVGTGPLANAALVAAGDDRIVVGKGEYLYRHLEGHGTGTIEVDGRWLTALIPTEIEVWIGRDHSGRMITHTGEPQFLSESDRAAWEAAGRPEFSEVGTEDRTFEAGELFPEVDLESYPTDPESLYATLFDEARDARPNEEERHEYVFTLASDLLFRFPEASPELRSALFEVLGKVPGTEVREDARHPGNGRSALVSLTVAEDERSRRRHEVYFDADTAQIVGFQEVVIAGTTPGSAGEESLHSNAILLDSGVVDTMRSRP